jgi:hypothetical protein
LYFDFDLNDDQHDNHHRSRDGHEEIKRVPTGYFYPIFCAANRTTRKAKKEPQRKEEKLLFCRITNHHLQASPCLLPLPATELHRSPTFRAAYRPCDLAPAARVPTSPTTTNRHRARPDTVTVHGSQTSFFAPSFATRILDCSCKKPAEEPCVPRRAAPPFPHLILILVLVLLLRASISLWSSSSSQSLLILVHIPIAYSALPVALSHFLSDCSWSRALSCLFLILCPWFGLVLSD